MLNSLNIPYFLPMAVTKRQWSDRIQAVSAPLFPGYLFVRIDPWSSFRLAVLKVPGIVNFISGPAGPLPIADSEIWGIQRLLSLNPELSSHPLLKCGDRVRLVRGPLAGLEGHLVRIGPKSHFMISIEAVNRSLAITVAERDVEPVSLAQSELVQELNR
jgi:transcription antitermination factor NusG